MTQTSAIEINGHHDLPLQCPNSKSPTWSLHPRVFLDVISTGHTKCPYCGTEYQLIPGTEPHGH